MFSCAICNTSFASPVTLRRHNSTVEKCLTKRRKEFACTVVGCSAKYNRNDFLLRHERTYHGMPQTTFNRKRSTCDRSKYPSQRPTSGQEIPTVREPIIIKAIILNEEPLERCVSKFFESSKPSLGKILTDALQQNQQIVFDIVLQTRLLQSTLTSLIKPFSCNDITLRTPVDLEDTIDVVTELITMESIEEDNKSKFNEILHLEVNISKLRPQIGGYVPLHPEIVALKAVLNVKNHDSYCFKWAILAGLSTDIKLEQHLNIPSAYGITDIRLEKIDYYGLILDFSGLSFPMVVGNSRLFEKNNPTISLNVFGVEETEANFKIIGPLYRTRSEKVKHINLLYYENQQRNVCHYAYIKLLAILLRQQLPECYLRMEMCNSCLKCFKSRARLERHKDHPKKCKPVITF